MDRRVVKVLAPLLWATVAGCLVGALAGWGLAQALHLPQVDQLASHRPASSTRVYANDHSQVASFALEQRVELNPDQIPNNLKLAIVASEDANFYEHGGIDPHAIVRAVVFSVVDRKMGSRGGASTLTQQLALNLFLKRERTLSRKIKEALLAIDIEKRFSKDQILTFYANQIFLGHGAYGVEAASRLYFDRHAGELTLAQAAMLAGIIPSANNRFDPIRRPDAALERRARVLERMLELGFVDRPSFDAAMAEPLGAALHRQSAGTGAYLLEMVRQEIESRYSTESLYTKGLQVDLTMDPTLQQTAEEALREGLVALDMKLGFRPASNVLENGSSDDPEAYEDPWWRQRPPSAGGMTRAVVTTVDPAVATLRIGRRRATLSAGGAKWTGRDSLTRLVKRGDLVLVRLPDPLPPSEDEVVEVELLQEPSIEGAMIAMDSDSGAILALVGGFDFDRSEFNRATQAMRQCGSAFKPFVYLTAFEQGYTPADTLFDAPFLLPDSRGELTYCPKNYHNQYYGITTLRRALELSFNASAVKLQQLVGGEAVVEVARKFGITTPLHPYPSMALGSLETRLVDLVRAYAAVANQGEVPTPHFITEVRDRDGRMMDRVFPRTERVTSAPVSYLLLQVLRGVVQRGTGAAAAALPAPVAGKTGTTDDYTDAWFVGFSPRLTLGVWVGRDLKTPIGPRMTGAEAALPIWIRFMESYFANQGQMETGEDFPVPAGVVFSTVDWYSGRLAVPGCDKVVLEAFLDGTEPVEACGPSHHRLAELPWPFQVPSYSPRTGEPMPSPAAVAIADGRATGRLE